MEVLSDGSLRVEITTTVQETEPYDIQIQGSDRRYPAIVLRLKHRGRGATITTISRKGQHKDLYSDYHAEVERYAARRKARLDNSGKERAIRGTDAGTVVEAGENWLDKAVQSVVERR